MSLVISLDSQLTLGKDVHLIFGVVFLPIPCQMLLVDTANTHYIHTSVEFAESIFQPALAGQNYWIASDPKMTAVRNPIPSHRQFHQKWLGLPPPKLDVDRVQPISPPSMVEPPQYP
jgi:hypothetical protein